MKKIFYYSLCFLTLLITACNNEDELNNNISFESPYVIKDDPNDPIQHQRYLIYEKYGVAVFFNDTLSNTYIGTGYDGKPMYRYETLDFNWGFSSHNKNDVKYSIEYIEDLENKEKGLKFAEEFLKLASKPMRPFSMFFPETFTVIQNNETDEPEFWSGFRTLVIPNVHQFEESDIPDFSNEILLSLVKSKVMNNEKLVAEFAKVSDQKYGRPWVVNGNNGGLGCVWGVQHKGTFWKPRELFNEGIMEEYFLYSYQSNVSTPEEFIAERTIVFDQIGQYGFICGDKNTDHVNSPKNVEEDLEYYLDTLLEIGKNTFIERYGNSSLVLKKFNLLADYINNELKLEF